MRWVERQAKVEQAVYDAMEELADKIGVEIPYFPHVIWVGSSVQFSNLVIPKKYWHRLEELEILFEGNWKYNISFYFHEFQTMFIFNDHPIHILEESAHALHLILSEAILGWRNKRDYTCFLVLLEVNGFLGARLLGSTIKDPYAEYKDMSRVKKENMAQLAEDFKKIGLKKEDLVDIFVHQQGYGLGERIYLEYLAGNVSVRFIRNLFLDPLRGKNFALRKFTRLKNRFWPAEQSDAVSQ